MRKVISALVLFVMLVVLPAGSWYYLRTGLDYRINALKELKDKTPVANMAEFKPLLDTITGKTAVILLNDLKKQEATDLYDQFKEAPSFIMVASGLYTQEIINTSYFKLDSLTQSNLKTKFNKDILLIDTDSNIRNTYNIDSESLKLLVKHIATIIPVNSKKASRGE